MCGLRPAGGLGGPGGPGGGGEGLGPPWQLEGFCSCTEGTRVTAKLPQRVRCLALKGGWYTVPTMVLPFADRLPSNE